MTQFHPRLILTLTIFILMAIPTFGKESEKKILVFEFPETYRWVTEHHEDAEFWSVRYKGFLGDAKYADIEIEQTNMLHEHIEMSPQQLAKQITILIKNFDDTANLSLQNAQEVDGDDCLFYTITTADTTYLLFYRLSKTITHSVEMELSPEQLELHDIQVWGKVFFESQIKSL